MHIIIDDEEPEKIDWVRKAIEMEKEWRQEHLDLIRDIKSLSKGQLIHIILQILGRVSHYTRSNEFEDERVHWDEERIAADVSKIIETLGGK